jgi:hypothetical protein
VTEVRLNEVSNRRSLPLHCFLLSTKYCLELPRNNTFWVHGSSSQFEVFAQLFLKAGWNPTAHDWTPSNSLHLTHPTGPHWLQQKQPFGSSDLPDLVEVVVSVAASAQAKNRSDGRGFLGENWNPQIPKHWARLWNWPNQNGALMCQPNDLHDSWYDAMVTRLKAWSPLGEPKNLLSLHVYPQTLLMDSLNCYDPQATFKLFKGGLWLGETDFVHRD